MVIVGSKVWGCWGVPVMSYSGNTLSWTQPAVFTSHQAWLLMVPCVAALAAKFAEHWGMSFCKHATYCAHREVSTEVNDTTNKHILERQTHRGAQNLAGTRVYMASSCADQIWTTRAAPA